MSLWDHKGWKGGFPFSPTRLALPSQARAAAGVTAPVIPDAIDRPQPWRSTHAPLGRIVVPDALGLRTGPAARRMAPRGTGLRLIPLAAFVWGSGRGAHVLPRTRPDHTLIWVTAGRLRLHLPRRVIVLGGGEVRYIPAGTAFATQSQPDTDGHVLLIAPDLTAGTDPSLPSAMFAGNVGQAGSSLLATLRDLSDEAARGTDAKALACHLNLLSLRLSRLDPERDHVPGQSPATPDRPLVDRFLALAAIEIGSWRTLADQAQDLGTTLTQLDRACIEARGQRAVDLLHALRLERASELLRHTDRPTPRIAQDLGYASHAHFTRVFVAATGRTPDAYRQQMRMN